MAKKAPYERQNKLLRANVEKYISLYDLKDKAGLAARIPMHRSTMYDRMAHPENFNLWELRRLFALLGFTDEEILQVVKP